MSLLLLLASITQAAHQQQDPLFDEEEGKVNVSSIAPNYNPEPPQPEISVSDLRYSSG